MDTVLPKEFIENRGWELESHIRPIGDLIEHEFSLDCICGPCLEQADDEGDVFIIIHHSLDGREQYEEDHEDYED